MEKSGKKRETCRRNTFAVIFGGIGKEHSVSLESGANFIKKARALGYEILPICVKEEGDFRLMRDGREVDAYPVRLFGKSGFLIGGELIPVRSAAIIMHGDFGEDGVIQGALMAAGIDFIGSDTVSGAVSSDKYFTKCIADSVGVPTLKTLPVYGEDEVRKIENEIGYPVFIKPMRLGSSVGASFAYTEGELERALGEAFALSDRVIAQPCLTDKRELEVAYYSSEKRTVITPPAEVDIGGGFYSFSEKYSDKSRAALNIRAEVSREVISKLTEYTAKLAKALGVRHFARFDYFLTAEGQIYFNEVNTIPGMTEKSMYLGMLERAGVSFGDLLAELFGDPL